MAICKKCGESFHTCPNCGLVGWEWDYCTGSCYEESEQYILDGRPELDTHNELGPARRVPKSKMKRHNES